MRSVESTTIDGHTYRVTQVPARIGRKIMLRLMRVLEPIVSSGGEFTGDILRKALTDDDLDFVCEAFAECTTIGLVVQTAGGGQIKAPDPMPLTVVFDDHFAGRYGAMLKWLAFCVQFNFASFFAEAGNALPGLVKAAVASAAPTA